MKTKIYLHSEKETMREEGENLGLTNNALDNFMRALYEVEFDIEVDPATGNCEILKVNGKEIKNS